MATSISVSEEFMRTRGIKHNRNRHYTITLCGESWYALLHNLEERAEHSNNFVEIKDLVILAVEIRSQLRTEGF